MNPPTEGLYEQTLTPDDQTIFDNHYLPSYTDDSPRLVILTVSLLTTIAALTRMRMIDDKHTHALHFTLVDLIHGNIGVDEAIENAVRIMTFDPQP